MIRFRQAAPEDAEALFALWKAAVDETHGFLAPEHKAQIAFVVREQFLPNTPLTLAVDEQDRPLGFIAMSGDTIDALFVDPVHHGRGIGRALVGEAALGHDRLAVDVNVQNESGLGFYRRLGFTAVGRSETYGLGLPYPLIHMKRCSAG